MSLSWVSEKLSEFGNWIGGTLGGIWNWVTGADTASESTKKM